MSSSINAASLSPVRCGRLAIWGSLAGQPHSHTRSESGHYCKASVAQRNVIIAYNHVMSRGSYTKFIVRWQLKFMLPALSLSPSLPGEGDSEVRLRATVSEIFTGVILLLRPLSLILATVPVSEDGWTPWMIGPPGQNILG